MPHPPPPPPHTPLAKKEKEMVDYRETESLFYFALCPCLQGETGVFCPTLYMTFTARSLCGTG